MALSKNFRKTYYNTLGVISAVQQIDVESSFASLLGESAINFDQLLKLALEFGIPPTHRTITWKLLLGIIPIYKEAWDFVQTERQATYDDILLVSKVMRRAIALDEDKDNEIQEFLNLYMSYQAKILGLSSEHPIDIEFLYHVAHLVFQEMISSTDRFWCFVALIDLINPVINLTPTPLSYSTFYNIQVHDFETIFLNLINI